MAVKILGFEPCANVIKHEAECVKFEKKNKHFLGVFVSVLGILSLKDQCYTVHILLEGKEVSVGLREVLYIEILYSVPSIERVHFCFAE